MALKYKWSLIGSFCCSALVALLWSANLGTVYPFVEVVFNNRTLHDWADDKTSSAEDTIKENRTAIVELETCLAEQKKAGDEDAVKSTQVAISVAESEITTSEAKLEGLAPVRRWINRWAPKDPFQTLVALMGIMFIGTVLRGIFLMGNMILIARVGQRTSLDVQNTVFENVLKMEISELDVKGTGDLISRVRGETGAIGGAVMTLFGKTVREPMKMIFCLTGAAIVNWRLLLFSMLICPLAGYFMVVLARLAKSANRKAMEESAKLLTRLFQAFVYLRVVKSFTMEEHERDRFQTVARDVYKKAMRISWFDALARVNNEMLGVCMISLSVLAGGYLVMNQQVTLFGIRMCAQPMSVSTIFVFFAFLIGIADPLRKMADCYNRIQSGVVAADRVFPLIDQIPAVRNPTNPIAVPAGNPGVNFVGVDFEYLPGTPILNELSFEVPAGSSLAIVGHNGCGKSTAINLLPRFFDVGGGQIEIGGTDIRKFNLKLLRKKISYVTQQTMLFGDTVAENIGYGSLDATREQIISAARKAHAHEFISELPEGYDSNIGEYGGTLSGGQRQRISLARAIMKNPEILLLDEATSQIDPESEVLIHKALAEFIEGRTTIIVTHRLSTLDLVDRILIMRQGRAIDCGTHEQLLARCPEYRAMRQTELEGAA